MKVGNCLTCLFLAAVFVSACSPVTVAPGDEAAPTQAEATLAAAAPTAGPATTAAAVDPAPAVTEPAPPNPVRTELQATDPTTVSLASGRPMLVEFFAFW